MRIHITITVEKKQNRWKENFEKKFSEKKEANKPLLAKKSEKNLYSFYRNGGKL